MSDPEVKLGFPEATAGHPEAGESEARIPMDVNDPEAIWWSEEIEIEAAERGDRSSGLWMIEESEEIGDDEEETIGDVSCFIGGQVNLEMRRRSYDDASHA